MPISSIVRRSASRICAALRIRIAIFVFRVRVIVIRSLRDGSHRQRQRPHRSNREHAVISVFDHGFLYGEGIYETLRTYDGEPFLFDRHMRRLRKSADMLALTYRSTDAEHRRAFRDTMRAAGLGTPIAKPTSAFCVTRGIGELTYDPTPRRTRRSSSSSSRMSIRRRRCSSAASRSSLVDDRPQSSGNREPDDQVEQPAEQRARHAGGVQARRVRRRDAQLQGRARRVHAVEPVHRQGRRGADAADRRRPAARHHARVPLRSRRGAASRCARRCCATRICSAPTNRS